jgi:repressor LexA
MKMDDDKNRMAPDTVEMCRRIKYVRKQLKISQKDFAASVGVSQGHLCVIEKQERAPLLTLLKAICYEHKVSLEWLLNGEGEIFSSCAPGESIPVFEQLPESYPEGLRGKEATGYLSLPGLPQDSFAIYQRGDYMAPTIHARDLVICEPADTIANDDLVLIKNKWDIWMIRRFRKTAEKCTLTADNPNYRPFEYDDRAQRLIAKVISILRYVNF